MVVPGLAHVHFVELQVMDLQSARPAGSTTLMQELKMPRWQPSRIRNLSCLRY